MKKPGVLLTATLAAISLLTFTDGAFAAGKAGGAAGRKPTINIQKPEISKPDIQKPGAKKAGVEKPATAEISEKLDSVKNTAASKDELKQKLDAKKSGLDSESVKKRLENKKEGLSKEELKSKIEEKTGGDKCAGIKNKVAEKLSGEQKANLEKLSADAASIKSGSQVKPEMKTQFENDIKATLSTANQPSTESVQKFAADVSTCVSDQKIAPAEAAKLTADVNAILNSAGITKEETAALKADAEAIINAANISEAEKEAIKTDMNSIVSTAQKNAAEIKQTVDPAAASQKIETVTKSSGGGSIQQKKESLKDKINAGRKK